MKNHMEKGNVLVLGNSGVGKSTLINAVLGEDTAKTGWGTKGTTDALTIYEGSRIPFRVIDTIGFEPAFFARHRAINAVKKWSSDSAKAGHEDSRINVIWFCVEGTSSKLFPQAIDNLTKATAMWPSVPVIVAITKSYSVPEREQNIEMVRTAFAKQKRYGQNLRYVIPVVAATYVLNDAAYAAPEGISELIDATNLLMPEGIKASETDIAAFQLNRKRAIANSVTAVSTTAAVTVAAVPIPIADALILSPIEIAEINAIAQIYGIRKNEESSRFLNSIVEVGTVSVAAKAAISALKVIPGINLGASVLNAIIAGSIVAALGGASVYAFEQVYLGKKTLADIDWVKKVMESALSSSFIEKASTAIAKASNSSDSSSLSQIVLQVFGGLFDSVRNRRK